ncbi:class I adenylate-forming enzyme family protein [Candidatus Poriferisocius sp.]|uniref:class I adenylate-forming enzyme family protein n=1 Tax=Candidatus Poriferisocius sp. TaxID=3101276 RepID=UPI003B5B1364
MGQRDERRPNLTDLVLDHPFDDEEPLLHDLDRTWRAGEVRREVRSMARRLADLGCRERGVAVNLERGAEVVLAMAAVWEAGGVFVPINPRLPDQAVSEVVSRLRPALMIDAEGIHPVDLGPVKGRDAACTVYDQDAAFVLWTSGTSGDPTPVLNTHEGYLEIIDRVLEPLRGKRATGEGPAKRPTPNLIPVSMALNAGIYNALFGLRAGAALVVMDRFTTADFATLVRRHRIRSTILPPAAMAMLNDDPDIADLGELKYVRSVTAPLSPFQARRFADRFGVVVLNGYGQAEMGEVIGWTAADAREHPDKIGAAGRPHPGVSVRIEAPDANGVGELVVRPPLVWDDTRRAALAGRLTADDHIRTGDLARLDDEGFVWIEGRLGDVINRGGNKVVPTEVEEVLAALPQVSEAAVVAEPDDRLGQVPVAFVVERAPVTDQELEQACRAALAPYKVPVRFERRPTLPRNEVGKLLRRSLDPR